MTSARFLMAIATLACLLNACYAPVFGGEDHPQEVCEEPALTAATSEALSSIDCSESQDTGYSQGKPFAITVVSVDGKKVETATANAYYVMAQAAAKDGVTLKVNSGFRTMAEQQYLYGCYVNCSCNNCNLAASPGYSNHQSGHALDLNTASAGVYDWLNAHAAQFGFKRTVPSEAWHWEWWGGGPGGGPCGDCDRSASSVVGSFTFSCDGPEAGATCVQVDEPSDPHTWGDNYVCSATNHGAVWSYAGAIDGMDCTPVAESASAYASAWSDNYWCVPPNSMAQFAWSSAGPMAGWSCVHWNEPQSQSDSFGDNFLCVRGRTDYSNGYFTFSSDGPNDGQHCISVNEPSDPDSWSDNYLCTPEDVGLEWSIAGPITGKRCVAVTEPSGNDGEGWDDNYLCLPEDSPFVLSWSVVDPTDTAGCLRFAELADPEGSWQDDWLCVTKAEPHGSTTDPADWTLDPGAMVPPAASSGGGTKTSPSSSGDPAADGTVLGGCALTPSGRSTSGWAALLGLLGAAGLLTRRTSRWCTASRSAAPARGT
ncbi:MAG: M15 family metallopeptidase [Myxococcales bacterium]|nr:M15 family metallopeptidase [Myxococcales bacterium]